MNIQELNYDAKDENSLCISVSGIDAAKFLQGQFSNDIDILTEKSYQNSSFSTNQGKVIAIFKIIKEKDSFIIVINKEISDYFIEKLSMYILMSKVNIEVMRDIHVYGVIGEVANAFIKKNNLNLYSVMKNNDVWILNNSKDETKGLTVLSKLTGTTLQKTSHFNANHFLDIKKGMIRITMESKEKYIPQVLNLEDLNGISYKKGCYTGQEIVARTHYLGKIKKKLVLFSCSSINLKIEDKIFDEDKQVVGEILTSAFENDDSYLYFAVIKLDSVDRHLVSNNHRLNLITF
tara:strand:+ start:19434 stop:20306 length:873 start_codon:yes stop_codon:yes gene_type:complete